jgi:DNA ligase-1
MPTPFKVLSSLCDALQRTKKRNEKKRLIAAFLRELESDELVPSVSFLLGRPLPETDSRVLDLGGSTLWRLRPSKQLTLVNDSLTIIDVAKTFEAVAGASGAGSKSKKESLIEGLLGRADPMESQYLFHILGREMRIGVVEGIVMDGISEASGANLALVRRANMLLGNIGEVAQIALTRGERGLRAIELKLFTPVKPMLADMSYNLAEVFAEHKGKTALEWKFDGARIQIHKKGDEVRVFTRRLNDVTESLPDIVSLVKDNILASEALIEGEAVAVGTGGKPLPFQDLMRRFRRIRDVEMMIHQIPLNLYLFDILYLNGDLLIDLPNEKRWALLERTVPSRLLAPRIITEKKEEAESFLESAIEAGHEGLMAKALASPYTPGIRGKMWLKIKPFETLDLVIIAAEWGYGRREGWLSNYHLAAKDTKAGGYVMLGKTFKGLTDKEFETMTDRLQRAKVKEDHHTVYVEPSIVVEVAYNELQKSFRYKSGLALRFARILRIREDKGLADVDSIERVRELYSRQFELKAKFQSV